MNAPDSIPGRPGIEIEELLRQQRQRLSLSLRLLYAFGETFVFDRFLTLSLLLNAPDSIPARAGIEFGAPFATAEAKPFSGVTAPSFHIGFSENLSFSSFLRFRR